MNKIWLIANSILLIGVVVYAIFLPTPETQSPSGEVATVSQNYLSMDVILETYYLDGKSETEYVEETITSMEDFWSQYEEWQVVEQREGLIRFKQEKDDISPYLKTYGYFGLQDGMLTIFEGIPMENAAIESFYQIDTGELETHLYERLNQGIKIESKENYLNVIETFKNYEKAEAVSS
ncbi:forespore regulator of the sigma-K checkpoint [Gracilibacillus halotolerans]|uniref:Forespore regulator of the sigma-K checkpoint n=1 Tax=Gracilibacillus halotolerans TaxID=74386 RepID=A0A841RLW0_9BACI|nr:BofC C-terminal domain-containing protein [Gracilibacillus halotolerans]MBB6511924.1 forespore regulator of the sigma-K checkpoint [Gracilibacillus halotolerans]